MRYIVQLDFPVSTELGTQYVGSTGIFKGKLVVDLFCPDMNRAYIFRESTTREAEEKVAILRDSPSSYVRQAKFTIVPVKVELIL